MAVDVSDTDATRILDAIAKVGDKVTTLRGEIASLDGKVGRMLAALDRLEGPLTLDAGSEIEAGTTIH